MVSPDTRLWVRSSSKLAWAAICKVHRLLSLTKFLSTLVQHLPKSLGSVFIEGLMRRGVWAAGALSKSRLKAIPVEDMDDVAHGLGVAAKLGSYLIGILLSVGAGKQDLTTAQGEGSWPAQSCLQSLALGVTQRTREDRFSHTKEDKLLPIILLGNARGLPSTLDAIVISWYCEWGNDWVDHHTGTRKDGDPGTS